MKVANGERHALWTDLDSRVEDRYDHVRACPRMGRSWDRPSTFLENLPSETRARRAACPTRRKLYVWRTMAQINHWQRIGLVFEGLCFSVER